MTKRESQIIKAIAVILMLVHHLWAFPERIVGGGLNSLVNVFGQPLISYIGNFGKICVFIFFFIGGYGIYASSKEKGFHIVGRIKKLFLSYWKVFLVFIPIAFLLFRNQPNYCANTSICGRYRVFIWEEFVENLLGISSTYNSEWWFFREYIIVLAMFPAVKLFIDKHSNVANIITIFLCSILVSTVFPMLANMEKLSYLNNDFIYLNFLCKNPPYIASFWMGCAFAKGDILIALRKEMKEYRLTGIGPDIAIILIIVFLKNTGYRDQLCVIYVPVFLVCCLDLIGKTNFSGKLLEKIGNQSTNIWLIHSFFCYYFYPINKVVTCTRYAIPSLTILLALSYLSSVAVDKLWYYLFKLIQIVFGELQRCKH